MPKMSKEMPVEVFAKKVGIDKKEQDWIVKNDKDQHYHNNTPLKGWLSLSYPVYDGDYYFAFIHKKARVNAQYNAKANRELKKYIKSSLSADEIFDKMEKYFAMQFKDAGSGDTMTREELWSAIVDMRKKNPVKEEVNENFDKDPDIKKISMFTKLFAKDDLAKLKNFIATNKLDKKKIVKDLEKKVNQRTFFHSAVIGNKKNSRLKDTIIKTYKEEVNEVFGISQDPRYRAKVMKMLDDEGIKYKKDGRNALIILGVPTKEQKKLLDRITKEFGTPSYSIIDEGKKMTSAQKKEFDKLYKKMDGGKEHQAIKQKIKNPVKADDAFHSLVMKKVLGEGKGTDIFKKYGSIINRLSDKEKDEVIELLYQMNSQSGRQYKQAFSKVKELLNMEYIPEELDLQEVALDQNMLQRQFPNVWATKDSKLYRVLSSLISFHGYNDNKKSYDKDKKKFVDALKGIAKNPKKYEKTYGRNFAQFVNNPKKGQAFAEEKVELMSKGWANAFGKTTILDEAVADITVDPKNRINSGQQQAYHGMEIAKQARRMGLKSAVMHKHVRIKGAKKAVNDFLRIIIGKSRYGDPTEKDMSTPQVDKMLTKGLK